MTLAEVASQAANLDDATFKQAQGKFEMMIQSACANTGRPLCSTDSTEAQQSAGNQTRTG